MIAVTDSAVSRAVEEVAPVVTRLVDEFEQAEPFAMEILSYLTAQRIGTRQAVLTLFLHGLADRLQVAIDIVSFFGDSVDMNHEGPGTTA